MFCLRWVFIVVCGLLIAAASLVAECGLGQEGFSSCGYWALCVWGSVVMAHRLSCPVACGIFPYQGLNPCPLHWQVGP